ncbi:MAG: signal recognition particle protein [Deltaproteobacteria bacterium]|nr:signal recognition particle protein [Deltaproteobacteria bacterium]
MFETLSRGFRAAKQRLSGVAELNEENIEAALRDVRMSLLEADVEFKVTKTFLERVKEKALGEQVTLKAKSKEYGVVQITPEQAFIKICQDELTAMMGPVDTELKWAKKGPTGIMMVGLQGSGKTTTVGKLARWLEKTHKKKPLLVAADVYRPAAIDQLRILGEKLGIPVFSAAEKSPPQICEEAMQHAREKGRDVVLFDTAGRLAIDEPLMKELEEIDHRVQPANIFLVVDAMIGQDAVNTAAAFHNRLNIDGVILTKLDGDARGGAALSIKEVTGKPIKFLGLGESLEKLEEFRPDGMASRILGMGDIVGLVKDFEQVVDAEKAEEDAIRMLKGKFDMQDFLEQIRIIQKMGSLKDIFEKMPFFGGALPDNVNLDDRELVRIEAMINSMTAEERRHPERFVVTSWEEITSQQGKKMKRKAADYDPSRVRRVALGSGRKESEVKELLHKFAMMRQMMVQLGATTGLLGKIPGFKQFAQMKKLAEMDVGSIMAGQGGGVPSLSGMPQVPGMPAMPNMAGMPTGLPPGYTLPGTKSIVAPVRSVDRAKEKRKRKEAKKQRKKARKKR